MVKCRGNFSFEDIYTPSSTGEIDDFDYSGKYLRSISKKNLS